MNGANTSELLGRVSQIAVRLPSTVRAGIASRLVAADPVTADTLSFMSRTIPDPSAREEVQALANEWLRADLDPAALGWSLLGASAMDDLHAAKGQEELVWTGPTPFSTTLRRTEQAIVELVSNAEKELWLVCFAAYKVDEIKSAIRAAAERGVEIRLVVESPKVSEGKVEFSALKGLGGEISRLASAYVWPLEKRWKDVAGRHGSLHVKCALADDRQLFVSSANLTEFAMTLNMELGVLVTGGRLPERMGQQLRWLVGDGYLVETDSSE